MFMLNNKIVWEKSDDKGAATPVEEFDESVTKGSESAAAPVETPEDDPDFDIESLISDDDVMEDEPEPVEAKDEEPVEPETTEEEPVEETPEEPVAEAPESEAPEEPTTPEEPVAQAPEPQPQAEPEPQPDPAALQAAYKEFFDKGVENLSEQVYKLDEETAELLDTEPSKVIPKLAATLHMQVVASALGQMAQMMPAIMATTQERMSSAKATEDRFFGEYPELKGHNKEVMQIASAFRQLNPKATYDQIAPQIAAAAKVQLKLFDTPAPAKPPAPKPVIPTAAATASRPAKAPQPMSEWDELIQED